MEIGVGLDHTLGMDWDDQANLAREAAELGYESIWTPENIGTDSFQVCARRWQASCDVVDGGLTTGIGVIAWGAWSLITTLATFVYEEAGEVSAEEILMNSGLNEGLLLSAVVIALGVIILELKKIQQILLRDRVGGLDLD